MDEFFWTHTLFDQIAVSQLIYLYPEFNAKQIPRAKENKDNPSNGHFLPSLSLC